MSEWPRYYILVDRLPVAVDHDAWMRWFETSDRQIGDDKIGKTRVSTVFLGIDRSLLSRRRPIPFTARAHRQKGLFLVDGLPVALRHQQVWPGRQELGCMRGPIHERHGRADERHQRRRDDR